MFRLARVVLTGASALALVLVLVQNAFADPRDFELRNDSSVDIAYVYVSPSAADDWGDDVMGADILPAGQSVDIAFCAFDGNTCTYDIKVIGTEGEQGYLYKVNLCSVTTVTFS